VSWPWPILCRAVAAHGLPGSGVAVPPGVPDEAAWEQLVRWILNQRLSGLLLAAVADGTLELEPAQRDHAARLHRSAMVGAIALEGALLRTADVLESAAVDFRVLKGTAVAHLDYPDPSLRAYGDVDLLVRAGQLDLAIAALERSGHVRRFPEPRPGFQRRFGKGNCMVTPERMEIDLHRSLAMGPFGLTIVLDDLWARSSMFSLAGRAVPALGPEERFLHAAIHAALGDPVPRLSPLRDVAQMLLTRPLDVDRVRATSSAWGIDAVLARAVGQAAGAFELPAHAHPLLAWAAGFEPTRRDRHFLRVYTDPHQTYAAKSFAALRAIPDLRSKLAYVRALLFPAPSYLAGRHRGRLRRWARGAGQILRPRPRS
jgi:hypothetical protein